MAFDLDGEESADRSARIEAAPAVGVLDTPSVRTVIRNLEDALACSEDGHHTAAAVLAGFALTRLEDVVKNARLPDYEHALRHRLIEDVEPRLSSEYDLREDP